MPGLGSNRDEERHVVLVEPTIGVLPSHRHSEDLVIVDERNAEKPVEMRPAGFRCGNVAWVSRCVAQTASDPLIR